MRRNNKGEEQKSKRETMSQKVGKKPKKEEKKEGRERGKKRERHMLVIVSNQKWHYEVL